MRSVASGAESLRRRSLRGRPRARRDSRGQEIPGDVVLIAGKMQTATKLLVRKR
jgi:hypothetical protein